MIFPHKERPAPPVFACSLINSHSEGLCMSCSTTGEPDFLQLSFPGKRGGQMNPDFPGALDDAGSYFNDFAPDGIELGCSPFRSL